MQPNGFDQDLTSKVETYLGGITVTDHNPAIFFDWDDAGVHEFVEAANAIADPPPAWFSEGRGNVSPSSVKSDVIGYLAQLGGGRYDHMVLAPNSLIQYAHLQERLQYMQHDNYLQACMAQVTAGRTLACIFVLTEPTLSRAVAMHCLPPPDPKRRLFE